MNKRKENSPDKNGNNVKKIAVSISPTNEEEVIVSQATSKF